MAFMGDREGGREGWREGEGGCVCVCAQWKGCSFSSITRMLSVNVRCLDSSGVAHHGTPLTQIHKNRIDRHSDIYSVVGESDTF